MPWEATSWVLIHLLLLVIYSVFIPFIGKHLGQLSESF